jgi:hypothetical protein
MQRIVVFMGIILLFGTSLCFAQAEQITITTYYPSPYGVYNKLMMSTLGVGDIDNDGAPDDDDAPDPATNDGDVWIGGNLSVGKINPTKRLDVDGSIGVSGGIFKDANASELNICGGTALFEGGTLRVYGEDEALYPGAAVIYTPNAAKTIGVLRMRIDGVTNVANIYFNGNVGIGTASPAEVLDVSGNIHCTGKLSSDGGNDPPYVAYSMETRNSIIERVDREIPQEKLNQAVLFWNEEADNFEVYLPAKGEFRDLQGQVLERL